MTPAVGKQVAAPRFRIETLTIRNGRKLLKIREWYPFYSKLIAGLTRRVFGGGSTNTIIAKESADQDAPRYISSGVEAPKRTLVSSAAASEGLSSGFPFSLLPASLPPLDDGRRIMRANQAVSSVMPCKI